MTHRIRKWIIELLGGKMRLATYQDINPQERQKREQIAKDKQAEAQQTKEDEHLRKLGAALTEAVKFEDKGMKSHAWAIMDKFYSENPELQAKENN